MSLEISEDLETLGELNQLREERASSLSFQSLEELAVQIVRSGCIEPLTSLVIDPGELEITSSWREGLLFRGVCARARGVMHTIASILGEMRRDSPAIYAAEAVTPFALRLRGLFPRFLGSEFSLDPEIRETFYPIPCEDLQELTLRSNAFDLVSTNEVLEHVPSIDKALREIHRVLRPGGWHVGTVPFHFTRETGVRRACLDAGGQISHLLEPEYHGDPVGNGALVFEIPGWDIINRARSAGFSRSFMRFILSTKHGILAEHIGGVFVLCCRK